MTCAVGGVQSKPDHDEVLFKIDWYDALNTGMGRTVLINDVIASSMWAIAADSPATDITIGTGGFDLITAFSWVAVSGGTTDSVYYIDNTIVTTGVEVGVMTTPAQTIIRQIRIRVEPCT